MTTTTSSVSEPVATRDVGAIDPAPLSQRAWPGPRPRTTGFQAVIPQSVLNEIHRHGKSVTGVEICGVLVGDVYRDASGPFLYVESSVRGNYASGKTTAVTFTAETWADIQAVMEERHPDKKILGWYHTHPGFGIFLSEMDLFIHENFFNLPWQVAVVFDPVRNQEGMFVWRGGRTEFVEFEVEPDEPAEETVTQTSEPVARSVAGPAGQQRQGEAAEGEEPPTQFEALYARLHKVERRQRLTLGLLVVVFLVALAWPLLALTFLPALQDRFDGSGRRAAPAAPAASAVQQESSRK
jgi:proteasome lid subunit RPN8/RPN11